MCGMGERISFYRGVSSMFFFFVIIFKEIEYSASRRQTEVPTTLPRLKSDFSKEPAAILAHGELITHKEAFLLNNVWEAI